MDMSQTEKGKITQIYPEPNAGGFIAFYVNSKRFGVKPEILAPAGRGDEVTVEYTAEGKYNNAFEVVLVTGAAAPTTAAQPTPHRPAVNLDRSILLQVCMKAGATATAGSSKDPIEYAGKFYDWFIEMYKAKKPTAAPPPPVREEVPPIGEEEDDLPF